MVHTDPGYNRGGNLRVVHAHDGLPALRLLSLLILLYSTWSLSLTSPEYHLAMLEDSTRSTGRLVDWVWAAFFIVVSSTFKVDLKCDMSFYAIKSAPSQSHVEDLEVP